MLRTLSSYDEFDQVIVPPRRPGDPLSAEVRTFYTELVQRAAQPGRPIDDSAAAVASYGQSGSEPRPILLERLAVS